MDNKVLQGFKKDFLAIKAKGFVPSNRAHDTGIGKTFEDSIGIVENNNFLADYAGVLEIKSKRELSKSMLTLFTKSPSNPKGVNSYLREKYGSPDTAAGGMKTLHTTFSALKFNTFVNKYGFRLEVDKKYRKLFVLVKDLTTGGIVDKDIWYDFDTLKEIIEMKCQHIAFISAKSKKENGKEYFAFTNVVLLKNLTFERFARSVAEGLIEYDIRIGVYRSGKHKGKTHDHGSGFRVKKGNLNKVFNIEEI
ncbi:MvaI/BcnI restriction endonuclease family protein [Candidatus Woesearchaeota archaeon]|nr:MvaI/BcnI restriction endonuclease family protein [Candidatus Woesearchaeota archaeon]